MLIKLNNIGKRYNYEWIFRKVDVEFSCANNYVILGSNGSGKSTLLQVIAGNLIPSEGKMEYFIEEQGKQFKLIKEEEYFKQLSYASPYLELFDEFTLIESIEFHGKFKAFYDGIDSSEIVNIMQLGKQKNKQIKYFSSGMKQRTRLALAILSKTPLLLLDEPTSNLDFKSIDWYQQLIDVYSKNRLIIVCSNEQKHEYSFCNKELTIEEFKPINSNKH